MSPRRPPLPEGPSSDLISQCEAWMRAAGMSDRTVKDTTKTLRRLDAHLSPYGVAQATPEELAGWLANPAWLPNSRCTFFGQVRRFYAWACDPDDPKLSFDPSARLRRPRAPEGVPSPASDDDVRLLTTRAAEPWRTAYVLAAPTDTVAVTPTSD